MDSLPNAHRDHNGLQAVSRLDLRPIELSERRMEACLRCLRSFGKRCRVRPLEEGGKGFSLAVGQIALQNKARVVHIMASDD